MPKNKRSRQQQWQIERRIRGLCICCGAEPLRSKNYGIKCLTKIREKARARLVAEGRYYGSASYQSAALPKDEGLVAGPGGMAGGSGTEGNSAPDSGSPVQP